MESEKHHIEFKDAFKEMYEKVNTWIEEGSGNMALLQQGTWIEMQSLMDRNIPIMFDSACDMARKLGILDNKGNFIPDPQS